MINRTIKGDLVKLFKEGQFDVIVHGCNCFNTMGAGIAKQIKAEFPGAYEEDCKTTRGYHKKLGLYSTYVHSHPNLTQFIINAYTQYEYVGEHPLCYPAVITVFEELNRNVLFHHKSIGIPKIGAGLAGGDWDHILYLINKTTPLLDITLVEYDK